MNATRVLAACLLAAALAGPGCKSDQKSTDAAKPAATQPAAAPAKPATPEKPLSVEDSARVRVSARVKAIDQVTRTVSLEDAMGHTATVVVGPEVRRLNEVSVGDTVAVEYAVSVLAELRPPTAEEAAHPVAAVQVAGRTPQGSAPAAGAAAGVRVVTTVQSVDQTTLRVTLRGPGGGLVTVKGRRAENVAKLKLGDTIVITYTESAVVALEKATK